MVHFLRNVGTQTNPASMRNVLPDYTEPRLCIIGFIVSYFNWRIEVSGHQWKEKPNLEFGWQPEHYALIKVAFMFEEDHPKIKTCLEGMMKDGPLSLKIIVEDLDRYGSLESGMAEGMPFPLLVNLMAFYGLVAVALAEQNRGEEISQMANHIASFLKNRIELMWTVDDLNWETFVRVASFVKRDSPATKKRKRDKERNDWRLLGCMAAISVLLIGANVLLKLRDH